MVITVMSVKSPVIPEKTKLEGEKFFLHLHCEFQCCQEIYDKTHLGNKCWAFSALRVVGKQLIFFSLVHFSFPRFCDFCFQLCFCTASLKPVQQLSQSFPPETHTLSLPLSLLKQCWKYVLSIVFSKVSRESWRVAQASIFKPGDFFPGCTKLKGMCSSFLMLNMRCWIKVFSAHVSSTGEKMKKAC